MTPCGLDGQLTIFGKLLLIRCLCPDRILAQARKYVADTLGPEYLDSKGLDLAELVEETERKCPLVGLISTGRLAHSRSQISLCHKDTAQGNQSPLLCVPLIVSSWHKIRVASLDRKKLL